MRNKVLYELQKNFPLVQRPFEQIAKKLNMDEDAVIKIVQEEKENKTIRQTSAIFDTRRLGYSSSLVAFKVDSSEIEDAVKILNSHPGISHNYERIIMKEIMTLISGLPLLSPPKALLV